MTIAERLHEAHEKEIWDWAGHNGLTIKNRNGKYSLIDSDGIAVSDDDGRRAFTFAELWRMAAGEDEDLLLGDE